MMRRVVAGFLVAGLLALSLTAAFADRKDTTIRRVVAPMRSITSAAAMQSVFDTINCGSNQRVLLTSATLFGDDSALTPTIHVDFASLNTGTVYLRLTDTYTANQVKYTMWEWGAHGSAFPSDSSIIAHTWIVGGAINTLDTMGLSFTYNLENTK